MGISRSRENQGTIRVQENSVYLSKFEIVGDNLRQCRVRRPLYLSDYYLLNASVSFYTINALSTYIHSLL